MRVSERKVALKCLRKSSENTINKFLNEIKTYSINNSDNILKIYGISQISNTKDYIMVLHNEYFGKCCEKCSKLYTSIEYKWLFEWIPYDQLDEINEIGRGGFTTIYLAIWKNGPLHYEYMTGWTRESNKKVALKSIDNLQYLTNEFINEAKTYSIDYIDDNFKIYGISQNPNTKDYIMVLQNTYCENCVECGKSYVDTQYKWCKICQINDLKNNFTNWTSKNKIIDNFIQEMQLKINNLSDIIFEWIPYGQFDNVEEISKGDVMTVYSAIWKNGPLSYNYVKKKLTRVSDKKVILKFFHNSQSITNEFLNEVKIYSISYSNNILKIYGLSQSPGMKDYIMVFPNEKCEECDRRYIDDLNAKYEWCNPCQIKYFKENFTSWSSAIWKDGPLHYFHKRVRKSNITVYLKYYHNLPDDDTNKFLNEVKMHLIFNSNFILNIYGISQDPDTKDYIVVLENAEGENFNDWAYNNFNNFNWSIKIRLLFYIIQGLKEIHQKKMVLRDFHTRNLLISTNNINDNDFNITILDMKLCGEFGNINETKVYGDIHYTAPEVLSGNSYTQATDIYSFGMIMYFMVTGNYPSDEIKQKEINEQEAPKCYIDLMEKCLDQNPENRPNVSEIEESINLFFYSYLDNESDIKETMEIHHDIKKQFEEAEKYRKANLLFVRLTTVDDVMILYNPLIQMATNIIKNIVEIREEAEYNKKICNALAERVEIARVPMELLKVRKKEKEKELRNESYYNAFYKFIYVLEEIEKYTKEISKYHGFRKYVKAISVKEKFIKLTEKYDNAMKDLHFAVRVDNEEYETFRDAIKIDSKYLELPLRGKSDDKRGKHPNYVVKRIYWGQEVACKLTSMTEEEMKINTSVQEHLEILMKLSESNHILRFYGVSKIDDINALVFEWAHCGTLKELYEKKAIQWHYKVQIALKICRGLIFLQKVEILHRDLRCENILMSESLEPKIYNFRLVDYSTDTTLSNEVISNNVVRWLAPEKLINYKSIYTTSCEIFSFGVLLWELAFEKIPYRSLKVDEIKDFVIKGGREAIKFGNSTPEISKLQEDYKKIINDTWKNNPQERISFLKTLNMLEELYNSISHMFDENMPALLNKNTLYLNGSNDDLVLPDENVSPIIPIISLDEGILAFRVGDHQKAWKCFEYHAENGNTIAKYWKGRYLWEGTHDGIKGREEGKELLKIAADEGNSDAQLRYAFTLINVYDEGDNRNIFMNYITKAAEGDNCVAQYNLGDLYYNGILNIPKDENKGIKWLRLAALHNYARAIKFLEEKEISLF
ncbi:uncharacterized protein OCT59_001055 [Rhizophagus irregularis]|uniref:uncharacterized protein n=1 Tax=Rhizophagus irregularis TaxID=588596 RepID=UPI003321DB56|nr:hypothetical protein OCT59_001055 [Rhizophagus irregularis]